MNFEPILDFFRNFQTERVLERLQQWNIAELINEPWFLASAAVLALIAFLLRWRVLLATVLGLTGFVWLLSYTMAQGTSTDSLTNDTLLVFIGGGVVLVGVVIYLLFVKTD